MFFNITFEDFIAALRETVLVHNDIERFVQSFVSTPVLKPYLSDSWESLDRKPSAFFPDRSRAAPGSRVFLR